MRATPRVVADLDEYPELRVVVNAAIPRIVELMEIHDIVELRRIRKNGVFDRPYVKDIVTPMGIPRVPKTVSVNRFSAGQAILDYLETIGIQGISLEVGQEDAKAIMALWSPDKPPAAKSAAENIGSATGSDGDSLDPTPVTDGEKQDVGGKRENSKQSNKKEKKA